MRRTSHTHPRQKQTRLLSKTHSQMFFDLDFCSYFEKWKFIAKSISWSPKRRAGKNGPSLSLDDYCGCERRHMIAVAMNITTERLIIREAESTHNNHHKHPLEIRITRKKNWNKRLTKHLGNLKKTLVKLQVISRWPRARQCRGPVRMLLINKGVSPLVRIPAVTWLPKM